MENDEIIESYFYDDDLDHSYIDAEDFQSLMDKARQDEREKMQGVEVWVSRDKEPRNNAVVMWSLENKPRYDPEIDVWISSKNFNSRVMITGATGINFNISPGQCKKFRIVEELT